MCFLNNYFFKFCFVYFLTLPISAFEAKFPKQIIISNSTDWPPYFYKDSNGKRVGSDYELLKSVLNKMNVQLVTTQGSPPKRAHRLLKNGMLDVMLAATKNEDRKSYAHFSTPYRKETSNAYCYSHVCGKAKTLEEAIEQNNKIQVLFNSKAWYGNNFENILNKYKDRFHHIDASRKRLLMLKQKKAEVTIDEEMSFPHTALKAKVDVNKISVITLYKTDVHFLFSKKSIPLSFMVQFNKALQQELNKH